MYGSRRALNKKLRIVKGCILCRLRLSHFIEGLLHSGAFVLASLRSRNLPFDIANVFADARLQLRKGQALEVRQRKPEIEHLAQQIQCLAVSFRGVVRVEQSTVRHTAPTERLGSLSARSAD
jgi:hypothetical protein